MADRRNATALPAPSRRSFITNTAALAGALALAAGTAEASQNPDADLLAKFARWKQLDADYNRVSALEDELFVAGRDAVAVPPELVHRRAVPPRPMTRSEVEKDLANARDFAADTDPEIPLSPAAQHQLNEWTRRAEAQLAARVRYDDALENEWLRNGLWAARERRNSLNSEQIELERQIAAMPAQTVAGLAAKLIILRPVLVDGNDDAAPKDDFWSFFGAEVIRDAERLAGLPQTLPPVGKTAEA